MVASRHKSSKTLEEEVKVKAKRKKRSASPEEPPNKRLRKDTDIYDLASDSDENSGLVVNRSKKRSTNGIQRKGTPDRKKKASRKTVNGDTLSRRAANGNSRLSHESSPSLDPSEYSSDDIDKASPRGHITPTKVPSQTSTQSKPSKVKGSSVNGNPKSIPRTSLNQRFVEVAVAAKEDKKKETQHKKVTPSKAVTVNGTHTKSKSSRKSPTAEVLDSIKAHVLGKLCGRIPIPLTGKPLKVAE